MEYLQHPAEFQHHMLVLLMLVDMDHVRIVKSLTVVHVVFRIHLNHAIESNKPQLVDQPL